MSGVLWIVQDGVLAGPAASQTVPYLRELAGRGRRLHLLSFERARFLCDRERVAATARELRGAGVGWTTLSFGGGPSTLRAPAQVIRGAAAARGIAAREGLDLVHARSYLPALMGLLSGRPFLFDMRGLWPRERVDGGIWREGSAVHRTWRLLESLLLSRAAGIVSLAEGAWEHLPEPQVPFKVIPTAVDLDRFRPGLPPPAGEHLADRTVYLLAGALGTWYLREETLDFLDLAIRQDPAGHVLVLSEEDTSGVVRGLRSRGVAEDRITVRGVPHREVPRWFSVVDAGILLIRSAPSKRASTPTKLGELLASGVPVVITPGIGDTEALVRETGTGIVVDALNEVGYGEALAGLRRLREEPEALGARCRRAAEDRLSLAGAVEAYEELYDALGRRDR